MVRKLDNDDVLRLFDTLILDTYMMPLSADTRQVVGGVVWAKADSVSHDSKRIFGAALSKTWLLGKVLSVEKKRTNEQSKGPPPT